MRVIVYDRYRDPRWRRRYYLRRWAIIAPILFAVGWLFGGLDVALTYVGWATVTYVLGTLLWEWVELKKDREHRERDLG